MKEQKIKTQKKKDGRNFLLLDPINSGCLQNAESNICLDWYLHIIRLVQNQYLIYYLYLYATYILYVIWYLWHSIPTTYYIVSSMASYIISNMWYIIYHISYVDGI